MSEQVWAIAGGKGGVGKTTTAAALAREFRERDRQVAVLDADLGMSNLLGALGADPESGGDLYATLAGEVPTEAAATGVDGLTVLTAERTEPAEEPVDRVDLESYGEADPARLEEAIEWLRAHNDTVVIDTASGLAHETAVSIGLADRVVLLTTPDAMAIENAATTAAFADRVGGDIAGVVVTCATKATDPATIADRLGYPLLGAIPEVETRATDSSSVVPSPATEAYRELAGVLAAVGDGESAEAVEPAHDPDWFDDEETRDRALADGDPVSEGDDEHVDEYESEPAEESGGGDQPGLLRRLLGLG